MLENIDIDWSYFRCYNGPHISSPFNHDYANIFFSLLNIISWFSVSSKVYNRTLLTSEHESVHE